MLFAICHHRADENGYQSKDQPDVLDPRPLYGNGSAACDAYDRKNAGFGDKTGKKSGSRRRRDRMRSGQPTVHGVHTGFCTETDDHHQHCGEHQRVIGRYCDCVNAEDTVAESL